jgi:hypothetical protein
MLDKPQAVRLCNLDQCPVDLDLAAQGQRREQQEQRRAGRMGGTAAGSALACSDGHGGIQHGVTRLNKP